MRRKDRSLHRHRRETFLDELTAAAEINLGGISWDVQAAKVLGIEGITLTENALWLTKTHLGRGHG